MALSRSNSVANVSASLEVLQATVFGRKYPTLLEYLASVTWEDNTPRQPATLTLFVEEGQVKLCLNDRAEARTGWVTATSWEEAIATLEKKLVGSTLEWRKAPAGVGGKGRGRG